VEEVTMQRLAPVLPLGLVLAVVARSPALATDVPIAGTSLLLRSGIAPVRCQAIFQAIDSVISLDPTVGSPVVDGAALHLFNPLTGERQCFALPAANWVVTPGRTYVYRDGAMTAGPVRSAFLKNGRVKVVARGAITYTLDEASQGEVEVDFLSGDGPRFCARFGAPVADKAGIFLARHAAAVGCLPEPAPCPDLAPTSPMSPTGVGEHAVSLARVPERSPRPAQSTPTRRRVLPAKSAAGAREGR
jgi:hypothetical protein